MTISPDSSSTGIRTSYSFLLAFVIAFLDFLPVFGTGAVFWPWIVVDIVVGDYKQAIFLGILYLVCQLIKQILQPKMVGDSVGINPLAALFYMFIGYKFAGVIGMIIGIPVGMIIVSMNSGSPTRTCSTRCVTTLPEEGR